ncbi:2'-5'-oligoadenylate synthase-like protein 2 [Gracilinanus agilis]|uniref:2'-5'-oligoadenylate synthase-like protein 2 n=1 Tax=Gracilinanus agilis TaxID=191870 RepID=UPI001CFDF9C5|nr:2'-5'-oligoadenylate synthase-like protein 2 [Gracilinanus agilis]
MEMSKDLYGTPAEELNAFVAEVLQPDREWKDEVKDVLKRMEKFFQEQCFQNYFIRNEEVKVIKVIKGGSSSKGVDLKHRSDVDLLLFLSCFSSYKDQHTLRGAIIEFMTEKLKECQKSIAYDITNISEHKSLNRYVPPRSLNFNVQSRKRIEPIHVDVLPVFNALEHGPCPEVYVNLIKNKGSPGEFTPSFSELQRNFVKHRPTKLKNLLRLVKYWYRQYVLKKYSGVPPKYAMELLTIYAWETGTQQAENFSLAEGFATVMELVKNYNSICIYWTKYYNFKNILVSHFVKKQLRYIPQTKEEKRPVILDPADPTNKVGNASRWDLVAKEASYCLSQACSQTKDGKSIPSWNVKGARNIQVTLKCPGLKHWKYCVNPYDPIQEIKKEIEKVKKIPVADQRLSFKNPKKKPKMLMGHETLAKYEIFYPIKIQVMVISSARFRIHVKFPDDTCQSYPFTNQDTALMVKQQIEEQEGKPVEMQVLRFQGELLRHRKYLKSYGIQDGDTLELELRTMKKSKSKKRKEVLVGS